MLYFSFDEKDGHCLTIVFFSISKKIIHDTKKINFNIGSEFTIKGISEDSRFVVFHNKEAEKEITFSLDLILCPISKLDLNNASDIEDYLNTVKYTSEERSWLELVRALIFFNARFDIQIEQEEFKIQDLQVNELKEFDINIEE